MSAWVDFGLYSLQAVLLWIVMPRWGASLLQPLFRDKASPRPGSNWPNALRAWGMLSVGVLLALRLRGAGWQQLLVASSAMLGLGIVWSSIGARSLWQRLKDAASMQQEPGVDTLPRARDELLSRGLQRLVYVLLLIALLARLVAGLIRRDLVPDAWGNFFTGLLMALLLFFAAAGSVARAPNHLDRVLGEQYRRMEVRVCYLLMAYLALLQLASLSLELSGLASRRNGALLVTAFVSMMLGSCMLLSSHRQEKGPAVSSRP